MQCPCGPRCLGADHLGRAPECIVSFTGDYPPDRFDKADDETLSFGSVVKTFAQTYGRIKQDERRNAEYQAFSCPSCDCEFLFKTSDEYVGGGRQTKKIAHLKAHP